MSTNRILMASLVAGVLAVAASPAPSFAAADAWTTAKTKMALMTSEDAPATDVNVDTVNGVVTLHGKVETPEQKQKAEQVAKGIEGVREVRNLLQVVPAAKQDRVEVADEQIRDRVVEAMKAAPQLEGSDIEVQSVNQGVVLLAGKADSFSDALSAVTTAARVPGVRKVASEIESPKDRLGDTRASARGPAPAVEKAAGQAGDAVADAARATSDQVSDMWITGETKLRLLADDNAPALDVNVDTENGVVTLFGVVGSEAEKKAAEANAREVKGVKSVQNELQVVSKGRQDQVEKADGQVADAVEANLNKSETLDDISVDVKNGVVRLSGEVPSEADRVTAAVVARSTPGVRSVLADDLKVDAAQG
jgi:hyperosmotically inducible periplasmic protein